MGQITSVNVNYAVVESNNWYSNIPLFPGLIVADFIFYGLYYAFIDISESSSYYDFIFTYNVPIYLAFIINSNLGSSLRMLE